MKLVLRAVTALAVLGVAAPAFPCGEKAETHASTKSSGDSKSAVAKAEKKDVKKDKAAAKTATN
jgi:hypothetical protein